MADTTGRTFICSVVFVDLVEYSKKSVAEQILLKETCNALIAEAIDAVPPDARIVLDTGDGAAITFLGDPEDALFVGLKLRDSIEEALTSHSIGIGRHKANGHIRVGINLGPVKIATNVNGGANIVGDGIAVAERIMGFALPGHMLVSRSFYEMVSRLSDDYGSLFRPDGQRTDPNGRIHELFLAGRDSAALQTAERGARERKKVASGDHVSLPKASVARGGPGSKGAERANPRTVPNSQTPVSSATLPPAIQSAASSATTGTMPAANFEAISPEGEPRGFLEDRYKVGFVALLLSLSAAFLGFLVWQKKTGPSADPVSSLMASKPPEQAAVPEPSASLPASAPVASGPSTGAAKPAVPTEGQVKPAKTDAAAKPVAAEPPPKVTPEKLAPTPRSQEPEPASKPSAKPVEPANKKATTEPAPTAVSKPALPEKMPTTAVTSPAKLQPVPAPRRSEPVPPTPVPQQVPPTSPAQQVQTPAPAPAPLVTPPIDPPKPAPTTVITKVSGATVEFPAEAVRAGVTSGYVRARVRIDANGVPAEVTIVESRPNRVFDRAVRNTLSLWRFNPGADNRIYEAQIDFNR